MPRQRRRFIELFLLVAVGLGAGKAVMGQDDPPQERQNARRFAAGDVSRFSATAFERLYLKHGAMVARLLAEPVPPLGAENFVDRSPVPEGLFDRQGRLTPPPGLTSANSKSVLAESRVRFEVELRVVLDAICRGQPVSGDAIEALQRRLAEWRAHASPRDVQAYTWCRRMEAFIDRQLAQPARHASLRESLLFGGTGAEFDGGTVGELIGFLLERDLGPAAGSAASRHMAPLAEALCRADAEAEQQERQARLDRAADRMRLATIERAQRAVAHSSRHARQPRSRNVPVFSRFGPAGTGTRILIWSNAYPVAYRTYYRVPGGVTYRYHVTTSR